MQARIGVERGTLASLPVGSEALGAGVLLRSALGIR